MPILKKKNKSDLPTEKELAALDGSVDELSRQTKQLLKGFGESAATKKSVPKHVTSQKVPTKVTVKKTHTPVKKGSARSFDIIHTPTKKKLPASLKSRPVQESPDLLSLQASHSDNEAQVATASHETPAIVHPHATGMLHVTARDEAKDELRNVSDGLQEDPAHEANLVPEKAVVKKESAVKLLTFDDAKEDESQVPSERSIETTPKGDPKESMGDTKTSEKEGAVAPVTNEQNYAHSTTRSAAPRRYHAVEEQELPTVFDTSEYHPELHDWSKLEQRHHTSWYVVVLLLVIGALAYYIYSGQPLPFIG